MSKWSLPGAVMFTLEGACSLDYLEDLVQGSARQRGTARALELACGRWPGVEDADRIVSGELEPFWTIRTETNAPEVGGTLTEYLDQMVLPWFRRHEREDCVLRTHIAQWMDEGRLDAVGHAFAAVVRARAGMAAEAASHLAEARSLAAQCRDDDEVGKLVEAAAAAVVAAAG